MGQRQRCPSLYFPQGPRTAHDSRYLVCARDTALGRRTLTRLLVGDLIEAVLKDLVEMHRLIVAGRHVFARDVKTSGRPWSRRMGTVSRCGRARSHPPPATVTHTTEVYRFMDAALISREWLHRAFVPERRRERARSSTCRADRTLQRDLPSRKHSEARA